ncbi:MAG: 2-amino-4-hydroxy-6-hydroxymethyldihydropteridine diphosphokinase [Acidobacteriaceae bacterium]|nr:2-amino-4-hydroxy-6-hydroxymethyldihydropteridine diphosphokinase [Acidobacteriaceae bacterium]
MASAATLRLSQSGNQSTGIEDGTIVVGLMSSKKVYLSLGSNLGDREQNLNRALQRLEEERIRIISRSSIYETAPQDVADQPWFLNLVSECETAYFPLQLLTVVQRIECDLGRNRGRSIRRGPRTIDIDILLFGSTTIVAPGLVVPHPRMLERRFVLEPLLEVAPDIRHPETKEPLNRFLPKVAGQAVRRFVTS